MSNLRNVKVLMTNNTTEANPATMTITNATALSGVIVTKDFPINVGINGDSKSVEAEASDSRGASSGTVSYQIQNIPISNVNFENSQSKREVTFKIGTTGPTYTLRDNGQTNFRYQGYSWNFSTQSNNLLYTINVTIGRN